MAKEFLVCIDSDGCAYDTMEIKHKECFCPAFIRAFSLQPVSKYAREAWEFVNLYSSLRGVHRFRALLKALELLAMRREVAERAFQVPSLPILSSYVASGAPLTNDALKEFAARNGDPAELSTVLEWSYDVNARIKAMVTGVPPFPHVRECLKKLSEKADVVVVSATPVEALEREWKENGLTPYLASIEGQESGTKKEIIASLKNRYAPGRVLMIGDAPGDLDAARAHGALFYPVCPGNEADSWKEFEAKEMDRFLSLSYAGDAEEKRIAHFLTLLPDEPAWLKGEK